MPVWRNCGATAVPTHHQRRKKTMTTRHLHAHRARLLQRSAALRQRAATELQHMQPALAKGDRLLQAAAWVRRNPMYLVGALAVLAVLRPRAMLRATTRVWSLWQSWQHARRWIARAR